MCLAPQSEFLRLLEASGRPADRGIGRLGRRPFLKAYSTMCLGAEARFPVYARGNPEICVVTVSGDRTARIWDVTTGGRSPSCSATRTRFRALPSPRPERQRL